MPTPRTARALLAGVVVPALLTLASCAGDDPPLDTTPTPRPTPPADASGGAAGGASGDPSGAAAGTYVALGDSFVAAPLVPDTDPDDGCQRSDGNYPHLVAAEAGYELVDVSCVAASSTSMVGAQVSGETQSLPQFDALDADVDLVTVTIGGNDFGLFSQLLVACLQAGQGDQRGASCQQAQAGNGDRPLEQAAKIRARVEAVTRGIRDRAPNARVIVANYPQLLPDRGSCPDLIPIAARDYPYVVRVNKALSDAVRLGGKAGGAEVVDVFKASKGHDICADEPWVNGIQTDPERALALHPFAEGQRAVADLVLAAIA
ncbi:SGNH/GDSL hydrolase family protein [Nocardioides sp. cx-173]|uniref:SGNH/GDSL hydrolase family protein n=1 Tax=Nocardioides sp. cx-173 TaxID=2898796 RepID=UPI001E2E00D5|nr:SGNH/GDSL hydrolase family protein [Nocardioides sp. cx-173]MCD4523937.1 SGNH/GDSL hydrolase family protein [Nocardioides sp. cx-173]UGB41747.1 SGNH/GDSL hydrolase family protein [Nocardioides sp. cx-173]